MGLWHPDDPQTKRTKNIAAVVYLLALAFLVGGSYLHQQQTTVEASQTPR